MQMRNKRKSRVFSVDERKGLKAEKWRKGGIESASKTVLYNLWGKRQLPVKKHRATRYHGLVWLKSWTQRTLSSSRGVC